MFSSLIVSIKNKLSLCSGETSSPRVSVGTEGRKIAAGKKIGFTVYMVEFFFWLIYDNVYSSHLQMIESLDLSF